MTNEQDTHLEFLLGDVMTHSILVSPVRLITTGLRAGLYTQCGVHPIKGVDEQRGRWLAG